ncbi:hypothetical protein BGX29_004262 [Mortierella sp. GBA35]|nr:hypothetical protein BGX29_004262 [Mortierella sp. GBA35]
MPRISRHRICTPLLQLLKTVVIEHSPQLGFALLTVGIIDTLYFAFETNTDQDCGKQIKGVAGILNKLMPDLPEDAYLDPGAKEPATADIDRAPKWLVSHPESARRVGTNLIPILTGVAIAMSCSRLARTSWMYLVKMIHFTDDMILEVVLKLSKISSSLVSFKVAVRQVVGVLKVKIPAIYQQYLDREEPMLDISRFDPDKNSSEMMAKVRKLKIMMKTYQKTHPDTFLSPAIGGWYAANTDQRAKRGLGSDAKDKFDSSKNLLR